MDFWLCWKISIFLFLLLIFPSLLCLPMKTATLNELWPLHLSLLFEFLPLCYIFQWSKLWEPQNYIILMRYFYHDVNYENFSIHTILGFWSGKCISKTCLFHAKHHAWIKRRSSKELLYLAMYGPSEFWLLVTNSHVTDFANRFRNT